MSDHLKPLLGRVADGTALGADEAETAFGEIMAGAATEAQIGALLMGLRVRGETVDEITGAVKAMRAAMTTVSAPEDRKSVV